MEVVYTMKYYRAFQIWKKLCNEFQRIVTKDDGKFSYETIFFHAHKNVRICKIFALFQNDARVSLTKKNTVFWKWKLHALRLELSKWSNL